MDIVNYVSEREQIASTCYQKCEVVFDEISGEEINWYSKMDFDLLREKTKEIDDNFFEFVRGKYVKELNTKTGVFHYYKIMDILNNKSIDACLLVSKMYRNFESKSNPYKKNILKNLFILDIDGVSEETGWRKPHSFKKDDKHLYILQNENLRIKIGVSSNIKTRLKAIEAVSGCKIKLLRLVENGFYLEAKLHEYYKSKRYIGEWFNLNSEDIKFIINEDLKELFKNNSQKLNF